MRLWGRAGIAVGLSAAAVLAGCGTTKDVTLKQPSVSAPARPVHPAPAWPRPGWVDVPVATFWNKPALPRPVDGAVMAASPDVKAWLSALSYEQRLDLDSRLATQALLDDPVTVEGEAMGWAQVLVDDQRGSVYRHGIEAWVPASQITLVAPPATASSVTVTEPLIDAGGQILSYGTRLPVLGRQGPTYTVATPSGPAEVPAAYLESSPPGATGDQVLTEARRFLGLPYLWAGTSGYGLDCSGLTYLVYRQLGITLPRDAGDQARSGTPVDRQDLRPGDLVFFAFGPEIDHVGIYAGGGLMIDSPHTGGHVEMVPLWSSPVASAYAGARRYLA